MIFQNFKAPVLGVDNGQLKVLSSRPNGVSTQAQSESKKVETISYNGELDAEMNKVEKVISAMPGAAIKTKKRDYLYAVFTTPLMRYRDDVEVYLNEDRKELHFRSASRVGYSDLGVNRKRYDAFAEQFSKVNR